MIKNLLLLASFLIFGTALSQNFDKKVLFTIDGSPVYASEFLNVYKKNLDLVQDPSQKDVDEYLKMFINYKLKVKEAQALGLDKDVNFKREFKTYRNQLAQKFLTDVNVTEALVEEAYNRTIEEVNAAHILFRVTEDAAPADTLLAYNKALEARQRIIGGEDFAKVARQLSEDPSAKSNAGELGWFNAFKMVYPFEDAAYKTEVGEISMPVRTSFGYHLIKVNNRRKSMGEVTAAHIMIAENKNDAKSSEEKIKAIYAELQEGASFEELAKKYSDDKATAEKGGKLNPFSAGKLNSPTFEKEAFALSRVGEISKPFKTKYGWHIVMLLEKHQVPSFDVMRSGLENRVKNDARARVITESLVEDLKKKYKVNVNPEALQYFQENVTNDILNGRWKPENGEELAQMEYVRIRDSASTYKGFAEFIGQKQRKPTRNANKKMLLKNWHEDFIRDFVLTYHQEHLETENAEFAAIVKEYKEGLLLFDLMEKKIWNEAKQDTLGLKQYYEINRSKYPEDAEFEETKGMVVNDYQLYLEEKWLQDLRASADVDIKNRTFKKVKKYLE